MEARVVAPETGMRIDGDNGGDNLGSEEKNNGKIERGSCYFKFFVEVGFDGPDRGDKNGHEIDKHHLVELENFGGKRPEKKRGDEEQDVEKLADDFGEGVSGGGHGISLTFGDKEIF